MVRNDECRDCAWRLPNTCKACDVNETVWQKWEVRDYFDVWGNAEDGYEVNDSIVRREILVLPETATDQEILEAMADCGFLTRRALEGFVEVVNLGTDVEVVTKQGMPLYGLRLMERDDGSEENGNQ